MYKKEKPDYLKNETGKDLKLSETHFNTKKTNFMNSSEAWGSSLNSNFF